MVQTISKLIKMKRKKLFKAVLLKMIIKITIRICL